VSHSEEKQTITEFIIVMEKAVSLEKMIIERKFSFYDKICMISQLL
jgi:hypothetical protein